MMLESNSSPKTGIISNVDVPYFLEKMPRLLFTSFRELVRRSIEGGYYLKAVFIFFQHVMLAWPIPRLNAAFMLLTGTRTFIANVS